MACFTVAVMTFLCILAGVIFASDSPVIDLLCTILALLTGIVYVRVVSRQPVTPDVSQGGLHQYPLYYDNGLGYYAPVDVETAYFTAQDYEKRYQPDTNEYDEPTPPFAWDKDY